LIREWKKELSNQKTDKKQSASLANSIVRVFGTKYILISMVPLLDTFIFRQELVLFTILYNTNFGYNSNNVFLPTRDV